MIVVSAFPNAKALPLWVARDLGLFRRNNLDAEIDQTPSSSRQRADLVAGRVHIVQSAVDNALELAAQGLDVVIVMGGESGMNDFIARADIRSFEQFRGRVLAVDSPETAYALQALEVLQLHGLRPDRDFVVRAIGNSASRLAALRDDGELGGAILNPPYSSMALRLGFRSLGRLVDLLGPYQAGGCFMLRSFATAQPHSAEAYVRSYVQALRWLREDANATAAAAILSRELSIDGATARAAYGDLVDPDFGFAEDARLSRPGMENVVATRRKMKGGPPIEIASIVDESFYQSALRALT